MSMPAGVAKEGVRGWLWGEWGGEWEQPPTILWEGGGNGNDPNWDSPPREKHEPNPGSPRGGKGDGIHQPPMAGVGGTAEEGGCW
jgi:hypothetical protein